MSRIQFEWEVEADKIDQSDGEDPLFRRQRRRQLRRMLLLIALLLLAAGLGALALHLRLIQVQTEIAQQLQDTVRAEVAALRIGDRDTYLNIQSGDDNWLQTQAAHFDSYEELKAAGVIDLTGDILSVTIDGEQARVLVREDRYGLPYARLWFYERGATGWRHTAPDIEFWGEKRTYEQATVTVHYHEADQLFARQLGDALSRWIAQGCADYACENPPALAVDVRPDLDEMAAWTDMSTGRLALRSPFVDLARADTPFDAQHAETLFTLIGKGWQGDP